MRFRRIRAVALAFAVAGVGAGCSRPQPAAPAASVDASSPVADAGTRPVPRDDNERLDEMVREQIDAELAESPTRATWLGAHRFDSELDDTSADAQARHLARVRAALDRLAALPEDQLDPEHRLDRALLDRDLRCDLYETTVEKPLERNPVRYVDIIDGGLYELLARDTAQPPGSLAERMRWVVQRLGKVRGVLDEARKNLKNPPELLVRRAVERAAATRGFVGDTLPRVVGVLGDDKLAADFRIARDDATRALDEYGAWLTKDVLPPSTGKARGELALGADHLGDRLRACELTDVPIARLVDAGEADLKAARHTFDETVRLLAPGKGAADAIRAVEDDHPGAEDLLKEVQKTVDDAFAFTRDRALATVPDGHPKVVEMPPFLWAPAWMTVPGPLEPHTRDPALYVDPVDRQWDARRRDDHLRAFPRAAIVLFAARQVVPGRWLLAEAARHAPSPMQRLPHSDVVIDGWPEYAVDLMLDQGFGGGGARLRLEAARERMLLDARLVAALRFHTSGKLDDAVRTFEDEAEVDDAAARREAERVAMDPMAMAAALGRLELTKLREDYRRENAATFALRAFHDKLLGHGAVPVPLLRKTLLSSDSGDPL